MAVFSFSIVGISIYFFTLNTNEVETEGQVLGLSDETILEFPFVELSSIYKDALSRGWEDWSWDTKTDFASYVDALHYNSIKVDFMKPNAGFLINAPHFDTSKYKSIKLSLYLKIPDNQKIYIEFSDTNGKKIGSQLLSWYTKDKTFNAEKWYDLQIPLFNLNATNINLGGIAIVSSDPGTIFVDDLAFSEEEINFPPWMDVFVAEAEPERIVILPYKSDFYNNKNDWRVSTGHLETSFNKMRLETGSTTNHASFSLKGGQFWTNYRYTIFLDWAIGDSISLVARSSSDNFFSCSFFDDGINVTLYQTKNGETALLDSSPNFTRHRIYSWSNTTSLGIEVKDDVVTCISNGDEKLKFKVKPPFPFAGGVGVELWSPNKGGNSMSVNKVLVEEVQ